MALPNSSSSSLVEEGSISEYSLPASETNVEFDSEQLNALMNTIQGGYKTGAAAEAVEEALSLQTGTSSSFLSDTQKDDVTDFEQQARIAESIVHLRDLLNGDSTDQSDDDSDWSEGSNEDYTQSTETSGENDFLMFTASSTTQSDVSTDDDVPRAEAVAATLGQIEELLDEARLNNFNSEAAWANFDEEEPASLITRSFRALVRVPFVVLKASVIGIWKFNVMLFKLPFLPFYVLQKTFYGIATFFATPGPSPMDGILEELNVEPTQDEITVVEEDEEGRQMAGSAGSSSFGEKLEFDRCSTDLNGNSEYNQSIEGCSDDDSFESEEEEKINRALIQLSDTRPFRDSPHPRRFFSKYAPNLNVSNLADDESLQSFYEPPTQMLDAPERQGIDDPAPLPLYDLSKRQGRDEEEDFDF